ERHERAPARERVGARGEGQELVPRGRRAYDPERLDHAAPPEAGLAVELTLEARRELRPDGLALVAQDGRRAPRAAREGEVLRGDERLERRDHLGGRLLREREVAERAEPQLPAERPILLDVEQRALRVVRAGAAQALEHGLGDDPG